MIKDERHYKILAYLQEHKFANVKELATLLSCSQITIRRDINELDEKELLLKVHGGAQVLNEEIEKIDIDFSQRTIQNTDKKEIIAKLASACIEGGQNIYLDAGSNAQLLIPYLKDKHVKVYTHGVHHITELAKYHIETHLIGGDMKWSTLATIGSLSIEEISRFHYDLAFLGTNALHHDFAYSTPDEHEAAIKQQIIKSSDKTYVLCDNSKFDKKSGVRFAKLDEVTLITNVKPPKAYEDIKTIYPKMTKN